jgi:hypothetical protein
MTIALVGLRELRIVWIAEANGSLRMTWVGVTLLAALTGVKARSYGR